MKLQDFKESALLILSEQEMADVQGGFVNLTLSVTGDPEPDVDTNLSKCEKCDKCDKCNKCGLLCL